MNILGLLVLFSLHNAFAAGSPALNLDAKAALGTAAQNAGVADSGAISLGAPIHFDQRVYSWTDKVRISITAPAWNTGNNRIDAIGSDEERYIQVATRKEKLRPFKFVETRADSGVFEGIIYLTGFPLDANGNGPQGSLENKGNDALTVFWKYSKDKSYSRSVPILWNQGALSLDRNSFRLGESVIIRVVDRDMNIHPDIPDRVTIEVTSDSDLAGLRSYALETGNASGIFEGRVSFTGSRASGGDQLHAQRGDKIYFTYTDRTLPPPYGRRDQLKIVQEGKIQ